MKNLRVQEMRLQFTYKFKETTWLDSFLIINIVLLIMWYIYTFKRGGWPFTASISGSAGIDYFQHIAGVSHWRTMYQEYSKICCFPPLAYCMYFLLWKINGGEAGITEWAIFKNTNESMQIFIAYTVFQVIILIWCIQRYYQKSSFKYMILLPISIFMSYPFFCTSIAKGNSVALVSIILCIAVVLGESEKKAENEVALLLIAVAAGFKLYPAIMGLIYVKKKDWKKAKRLVIYGIIAVFSPFCFFGGISGLKALCETLFRMAGTTRWSGENNTVLGLLNCLVNQYDIFSFLLPYINIAGKIFSILFLLICLICFFISKKKWQSLFFLGAVMCCYIPTSYEYNCVYFLPAFFMFFYENGGKIKEDKEKAVNGINVLFFSLLFSMPYFWLMLPNRLPDFMVSSVSHWVYFFIWLQIAFNIFWTIKEKIDETNKGFTKA